MQASTQKKMSNPQGLLERVQQINKIAAEECSAAFTKWVKGPVSIRFQQATFVSFDKILEKSGVKSEPSFGVYLNLDKGFSGFLLFLFSEQDTFSLLNYLIPKRNPQSKSLLEIEKSALLETGNILGCYYLNALTKELSLPFLLPSPPHLMYDLSESILTGTVLPLAYEQEQLLLAQIDFTYKNQSLNWRFFFIPHWNQLSSIIR
jgi:chemotaxis protein CheC